MINRRSTCMEHSGMRRYRFNRRFKDLFDCRKGQTFPTPPAEREVDVD